MKYSDLVKNKQVVDHIIRTKAGSCMNLSSQSEHSKTFFELDFSSIIESGNANLIFHHEGDEECIAIINVNARTLDIHGCDKHDISTEVTEQILLKAFRELTIKGRH